MKYAYKTRYVEAYQINNDNFNDLVTRFKGAMFMFNEDMSIKKMTYYSIEYISGDYICIEPNGRVQKYLREDFESKFDRVDR